MESDGVIEAISQKYFVKKVFLESSQNSQENTSVRLKPATLLKKGPWYRCFPVNFAKFVRTFFLKTPPVAAFGMKKVKHYVLIFQMSKNVEKVWNHLKEIL